jgi:hypothetical protein
MGGAIATSVHPTNSLELVSAVLGDKRSAIGTVHGQIFHLSCLPVTFGGGYYLSSLPDERGHSKSFEIGPDGSMKSSSSTLEYKGLVSQGGKPSVHEMLGILRSLKEGRSRS